MSQLDELVEQALAERDADLRQCIDRARTDVRQADKDLAVGNLEAVRHLLAAIDAELSIMRGLLP